MTNIKTRGFKNPAELREHLAELEEEAPADDQQETGTRYRAEIEALRVEVDNLRKQVDALSPPPRRQPVSTVEKYPWVQVTLTAATTFLLGRIFKNARLGPLGDIALPLLAATAVDRLVTKVFGFKRAT